MERLLGEGLPEDFIELRDRCVVELLYGCGLRRAELIQLQWQDWDRSNAQIKVTGKRSKVRILPLTRELSEILSHYRNAWEQCGSLNASQGLFVTNKGEPLYPKLVGDIVRKALSRVSTQDQRSPHVLRHSFATHLLDNGADLNAVKTLLGHANLAATQIYTHQSIEKLKEIHRKTHPKG
jgi:integrase/recombinase XerC